MFEADLNHTKSNVKPLENYNTPTGGGHLANNRGKIIDAYRKHEYSQLSPDKANFYNHFANAGNNGHGEMGGMFGSYNARQGGMGGPFSGNFNTGHGGGMGGTFTGDNTGPGGTFGAGNTGPAGMGGAFAEPAGESCLTHRNRAVDLKMRS